VPRLPEEDQARDPDRRAGARLPDLAHRRDRRCEPAQEKGPALVVAAPMGQGQSEVLEPDDRRGAVRFEADLDPARAWRKSGIAFEAPRQHDAIARKLDECAAGAIDPTIRLIEFELQL